MANATLARKGHPYHMVTPSPWPYFTGYAVLTLCYGLVMYMNFFNGGLIALLSGLTQLILVLFFWWRDVIREATFEAKHNAYVRRNLKLGFILFIVSEIRFFFGLFWSFFYYALDPVIWIGCSWPPYAIEPVDWKKIPTLNTCILLLSAATVTVAHKSLRADDYDTTLIGFAATLFCACLFTLCQAYEYVVLPYNMSDSVYGSIFYMITGFHGFHVIIGAIFISICFARFLLFHFNPFHHVGFECAIWYWHFVDIVWLFVFFFVYIWGNSIPNINI